MIRGLPLRVDSVSLNLPWGIGGVTVKVTAEQKRAAWALYVEYKTRIAGTALERGAGSPQEALTSLRTLFDSTRQVLREAGPDVAHGRRALGPLAILALNDGLRPFLVKWHTTFLGMGESDELTAAQRSTFDDELTALRGELIDYIDEIGKIAGVR